MTVHKTDIVCLSETYLDSSFPVNDKNLAIQGYNLVRCDYPTNPKRGKINTYHEDSLPLKIIEIQYLQECISFQLIIGDKLCHFIALYRSPKQSHDFYGDFNAKLRNWSINDKTNF